MSDGTFKMREWQCYQDGLHDFCKYINSHSSCNIKSLVEVGSYMGEGTCIFRKGFPNAVIRCIDPWEAGFDEGDATSYSNFKNVENKFDQNISEFKHIIKYKGTSSDFISYPEFRKVHVVYIDGCHTYDAVKNDIQTWLPRAKIAIGGHDFGANLDRLKGAERAVKEVVGEPDMVFQDSSWVKML